MAASILHLCQWLEQTPVGLLVRESQYGFPILVAIHIAGLWLSAGLVVWFDLRLLGVSMRRVPVRTVYRQLMPWAFGGFLVMVVSGSMLVSGSRPTRQGSCHPRIPRKPSLAIFSSFATGNLLRTW